MSIPTETVPPFLYFQHLLLSKPKQSRPQPTIKATLCPKQPNPEPHSRGPPAPQLFHPSGQNTASPAASPLRASPPKPTGQGLTLLQCPARSPSAGTPGDRRGIPSSAETGGYPPARRGWLLWVLGRVAPPPPRGRGCGRLE